MKYDARALTDMVATNGGTLPSFGFTHFVRDREGNMVTGFSVSKCERCGGLVQEPNGCGIDADAARCYGLIHLSSLPAQAYYNEQEDNDDPVEEICDRCMGHQIEDAPWQVDTSKEEDVETSPRQWWQRGDLVWWDKGESKPVAAVVIRQEEGYTRIDYANGMHIALDGALTARTEPTVSEVRRARSAMALARRMKKATRRAVDLTVAFYTSPEEVADRSVTRRVNITSDELETAIAQFMADYATMDRRFRTFAEIEVL
jgi:hypothetical protein